jgi:DNA-binding response OmpR family regulator
MPTGKVPGIVREIAWEHCPILRRGSAVARCDGRSRPEGMKMDRLTAMEMSVRAVGSGPFSGIATQPRFGQPAERLLERGQERLALGGRAFDILIALVERAAEVVKQRELISRVWSHVTVEEANLRVHSTYHWKALGDGRGSARNIGNVPG